MVIEKADSENDLSSFTTRSPSSRIIPLTLTNSRNRPEQVIDRSESLQLSNTSQKTESVKELGLVGSAIIQWPILYDVLPFKLGIPIVGLAAGATGYFVNHTFRKALLLDKFTKVSSYVATVGFPTFTLGMIHGMFVSGDIITQRTACPVCVQVRAAVIQLILGVAYPVLTAPIASYVTASALKDVYLPKLTKQPREVLDFTKQVFKPIKGKMGLIAAAQVILAMGVTYLEQESFFYKVLPVLEGKSTFLKNPHADTSQLAEIKVT